MSHAGADEGLGGIRRRGDEGDEHLYDWGGTVKVKAGQINGPVALLDGDEPYALATISCPFSASVTESVSAPETTRPLLFL